MKSHELAKNLLELPDKDVALSVFGHLYSSEANKQSHGALKIGLLEHYGGQHIVLGNIREESDRGDNYHVSKILYKEN